MICKPNLNDLSELNEFELQNICNLKKLELNKRICVVSACILGFDCRYNGGYVCDISKDLKDIGMLPVPVCPEQLSGLPTPRECYEIVGGDGFDVLNGEAKVFSISGKDYTSFFIKGAKMALKVCKIVGAEIAFMKNLSPSCGVGLIYDGSFTGKKKKGFGVTSALFKVNGIKVVNLTL